MLSLAPSTLSRWCSPGGGAKCWLIELRAPIGLLRKPVLTLYPTGGTEPATLPNLILTQAISSVSCKIKMSRLRIFCPSHWVDLPSPVEVRAFGWLRTSCCITVTGLASHSYPTTHGTSCQG